MLTYIVRMLNCVTRLVIIFIDKLFASSYYFMFYDVDSAGKVKSSNPSRIFVVNQ